VPDSTRPALVADTTSYLPPELNEKHDIHLVSLYVSLEGEQSAELELLDDLDGFYERLKQSEESVTTSQPSIGDFLATFEPLLDAGREIVSVHISASISGTYESAMQARDRLIKEGRGGERIHVVDSRKAAGGTGLVLLAAAHAIEKGASAQEASEAAEKARADTKIWFALNTLEYLRRGGRIGAAGALIGTTLKIKPILTFDEEVTPVEKVRTRARSIERLVGYAEQRHAAGADGWVVQHAQDQEAADQLIESCKPIFGCDPLYSSEIGPVLGAYSGPGMLGIGGAPRELLID
jgi:DegV family protein with EDD domain